MTKPVSQHQSNWDCPDHLGLWKCPQSLWKEFDLWFLYCLIWYSTRENNRSLMSTSVETFKSANDKSTRFLFVL